MADSEFRARGGVGYIDAGVRSWSSGLVVRRSVTWPFGLLRVGTDQIVVSSLMGEFNVTRKKLKSISRFGRIPVFASGFKFVCSGSDEAVIFWAIHAGRVLRELQNRGWPVERLL